MLSYKLKHMCSRAIASLSAIGLFVISTDSARAEEYTYMPGVQIKSYRVENNTTYTSEHKEANWSDYCKFVSGIDTGNITVLPGETGLYGKVLSCDFRCAEGWAFNEKDEEGNYITGITGAIYNFGDESYEDYTLTKGCNVVVSHDCPLPDEELGLNIDVSRAGVFVPGVAGQSAICRYTCKPGTHSPFASVLGECPNGAIGCGSGESGTSGVVSGLRPEEVTYPAACVPDMYMNVYQCQAGNIITGTAMPSGVTVDQTTLFQPVNYGEAFQIPDVWCETEGMVFDGWKTNVEFEVE